MSSISRFEQFLATRNMGYTSYLHLSPEDRQILAVAYEKWDGPVYAFPETITFDTEDDGRIGVNIDGERVAFIWNPEVGNPGISLPRVVDVNTLSEICKLVKERRHLE